MSKKNLRKSLNHVEEVKQKSDKNLLIWRTKENLEFFYIGGKCVKILPEQFEYWADDVFIKRDNNKNRLENNNIKISHLTIT